MKKFAPETPKIRVYKKYPNKRGATKNFGAEKGAARKKFRLPRSILHPLTYFLTIPQISMTNKKQHGKICDPNSVSPSSVQKTLSHFHVYIRVIMQQ